MVSGGCGFTLFSQPDDAMRADVESLPAQTSRTRYAADEGAKPTDVTATIVRLEYHSGLPFARVTTANGVVDMILDTGSDQLIVSTDFVQAAGLESRQVNEVVSDISGVDLSLTHAVTIDSLMIGDFEFQDVDARTFDFTLLGNDFGRPIGGILGLGLFSDHIVRLNLAEASLEISRHEDKVLHGGYAYQGNRGRVVVDLEIGSRIVPTLVDTGDNGYVGIHDALYDKLTIVGQVREISVRGFGGTSTAQEAYVADAIRIGPWQIPNGPVRFSQYPYPSTVAGRLGTKLLSKFLITIDQQSKLIYFEPISN